MGRIFSKMSLNRYEQTIFNYWQKQPDELYHWKTKVVALAQISAAAGEVARNLELELWEYFVERSGHTPEFKAVNLDGLRRVSLLNLAEYVLRLWGPPPKKKNPTTRSVSDAEGVL